MGDDFYRQKWIKEREKAESLEKKVRWLELMVQDLERMVQNLKDFQFLFEEQKQPTGTPGKRTKCVKCEKKFDEVNPFARDVKDKGFCSTACRKASESLARYWRSKSGI